MKPSALRIFVVTLCLAPATLLAHPGHADGAPVVHALTHGAFYVAAVMSIATFATHALRRTLLSRRQRRSTRDSNRG